MRTKRAKRSVAGTDVQKVQSFICDGIEYRWKVLEASLRNLVELKGQRISSLLYGRNERTIAVLYYCVCWCGTSMTENEFVEKWKTGKVVFRVNPKEKQIRDIYNTISSAAVKFGVY